MGTKFVSVFKKENISSFYIIFYFLFRFQIDSKQISRIPLQNELLELTIEEDYCHFNLRYLIKLTLLNLNKSN